MRACVRACVHACVRASVSESKAITLSHWPIARTYAGPPALPPARMHGRTAQGNNDSDVLVLNGEFYGIPFVSTCAQTCI